MWKLEVGLTSFQVGVAVSGRGRQPALVGVLHENPGPAAWGGDQKGAVRMGMAPGPQEPQCGLVCVRPRAVGMKLLSQAEKRCQVFPLLCLCQGQPCYRVTGAHEGPGEAVSLGLINLEGSLGGGEREGGFQELLA